MDHYSGYMYEIGGTGISVTTRGCFLEDTREDHYKAFAGHKKSSSDQYTSHMNVLVTLGGCAIDPGMEPILDGPDWWRMYTGENSYVVALGNTGSAEDKRLLKADRLTEDVEITVHPSLSVSDQGALTVDDPLRQPIDSILLMNHLAYREGVIVHAAGAIFDGMGFVFAGVSGAGKTTLTRQCIANYQGMKFLSDDRIIVRKVHGEYRAYGTPWPGDAKIAENDSAALKGLFFLTKGGANSIVPLKPSLALRRLFPVVSCPWYDKERLPQVLDTCEKIVSGIPCFEFRFTPDEGAVRTVREFIGNEL